MSHTAHFELMKVTRGLKTCPADLNYTYFLFEDFETQSTIEIEVWQDSNSIKNIDVTILDYDRFNSGLDEIVDHAVKQIKLLEGID